MKKENNVNDLISKVDIVNIISNFASLVKTGASYKTLCNVHGDNSPSLSINPKKQIYKCFVCNHGGNALDYLIWAQKFTWKQAIEYLIKESGDNIEQYSNLIANKKRSDKEDKILSCLNDASDIFNYYLNIYISSNPKLNSFIKERKITSKIINKFKLGFAPKIDDETNYIDTLKKKNHDLSTMINSSLLNDEGKFPFFNNRLIFPIFDDENKVIAMSGRVIENETNNEPKYLNSKESLVFKKSKTIFNYNNASKYDQLIIVEGYMDVIALSKISLNNAIALMGVSLSKENIQKLKRHKEILIFLDNDKAGMEATLKIIRDFVINDINCFVIENNLSKDPDEIINSENGENKLKELLENKIRPIEFIFKIFFRDVNSNDYDLLKKCVLSLSNYLKDFDNFLKLEISRLISKRFNVDQNFINKYLVSHNNVIELKNITSKQNIKPYEKKLEIEFSKPLNINKLLISIWQNPSFLKSQNIGDIKWPRAEYKKIFNEIKQYFEKGDNLSEKTTNFIKINEIKFKSKESIPKDIDSFNELIDRTKEDVYYSNIEYLDNLIENANSFERKQELLKQKLEIISKRKE